MFLKLRQLTRTIREAFSGLALRLRPGSSGSANAAAFPQAPASTIPAGTDEAAPTMAPASANTGTNASASVAPRYLELVRGFPWRTALVSLGLAGVGYALWLRPPLVHVQASEVALRSNQLTGHVEQMGEGTALVLPGLHKVRVYSLREQIYQPKEMARAEGPAPLQSVEGLSLGMDITVRYTLDASQLSRVAQTLPDDLGTAIVQPAVQGLAYKTLSSYTVREIFSTKRAEIQQLLEKELKAQLAQDGVKLRNLQIGQIDLPADYRKGMEALLAEELASEKMRFTLERKAKMVEQTALEGEAEKIKREKSAQATAAEEIIAAKAQEEAMSHVLPFKRKQIEQRQLEAEAEKVARIRTAEGAAAARRIEASGEADSRRQLADAEAYRQDNLGKIASTQMARDGALITKHPLLIQKTMADRLSDKIQVIIAPTPTDGSFIGAALLGKPAATPVAAPAGDLPVQESREARDSRDAANQEQ